MLDRLKEKDYEVIFESHALAILERDFPSALTELEAVLAQFQIPITEIIGSGGGETKGTQRLRRALNAQGWKKTNFEIRKSIRFAESGVEGNAVQIERESTTHEIKRVKNFEKKRLRRAIRRCDQGNNMNTNEAPAGASI
jgi:hypothetical protein